MAKLTGAAKAAFLAKMEAGRKRARGGARQSGSIAKPPALHDRVKLIRSGQLGTIISVDRGSSLKVVHWDNGSTSDATTAQLRVIRRHGGASKRAGSTTGGAVKSSARKARPMTQTMRSAGGLNRLSTDERAALFAYKRSHGARWKSALARDWQSSSAGPVLQRVRNRLGPAWLKSLRIPKGTRSAGSTAIVKGPAVLPARKGHPRGKIGEGTPAVRLHRVEAAVMDLASANRAIVAKVVEHEHRITKTESAISAWMKGRK